MNWTGGTLHAAKKRKNSSARSKTAQRQKKYFAQQRIGRFQDNTVNARTFVPSYAQEAQGKHAQRADDNMPQHTRQATLDQFDNTARVARRLGTMRERESPEKPRLTQTSIAQMLHPRQWTARKGFSPSWVSLSGVPSAYLFLPDHLDLSEDHGKHGELAARDRHWLGQPDWAGLGAQTTMKPTFKPVYDRTTIGKRRRLGSQNITRRDPHGERIRVPSIRDEYHMSGALPIQGLQYRFGTDALLSTSQLPTHTQSATTDPTQSVDHDDQNTDDGVESVSTYSRPMPLSELRPVHLNARTPSSPLPLAIASKERGEGPPTFMRDQSQRKPNAPPPKGHPRHHSQSQATSIQAAPGSLGAKFDRVCSSQHSQVAADDAAWRKFVHLRPPSSSSSVLSFSGPAEQAPAQAVPDARPSHNLSQRDREERASKPEVQVKQQDADEQAWRSFVFGRDSSPVVVQPAGGPKRLHKPYERSPPLPCAPQTESTQANDGSHATPPSPLLPPWVARASSSLIATPSSAAHRTATRIIGAQTADGSSSDPLSRDSPNHRGQVRARNSGTVSRFRFNKGAGQRARRRNDSAASSGLVVQVGDTVGRGGVAWSTVAVVDEPMEDDVYEL